MRPQDTNKETLDVDEETAIVPRTLPDPMIPAQEQIRDHSATIAI